MQKNILTVKDLDKNIINFVSACPMPAHIKDAATLRYVLANDHNLEIFGLSNAGELVGKDAFYLVGIMQGLLPHAYAEKASGRDLEVVKLRKCISERTNNFVTKRGYVADHLVVKLPVFDEKKVKYILTYVYDLTCQQSLEILRKKYQEFYQDDNVATSKFLQFLKFDQNICDHITKRELDVILSFIKHRTYKGIAAELDITVKAIEIHLNNLIQKFNCFTSNQLMSALIEKLHNWKS